MVPVRQCRSSHIDKEADTARLQVFVIGRCGRRSSQMHAGARASHTRARGRQRARLQRAASPRVRQPPHSLFHRERNTLILLAYIRSLTTTSYCTRCFKSPTNASGSGVSATVERTIPSATKIKTQRRVSTLAALLKSRGAKKRHEEHYKHNRFPPKTKNRPHPHPTRKSRNNSKERAHL